TPPPGLGDEYAITEFAAAIGGVTDGTGRNNGVPGAEGAAVLREALQKSAARVSDETAHPVLALAPALAAMFSGDHAESRRGMEALTRHQHPWIRAAGLAMGGHLA